MDSSKENTDSDDDNRLKDNFVTKNVRGKTLDNAVFKFKRFISVEGPDKRRSSTLDVGEFARQYAKLVIYFVEEHAFTKSLAIFFIEKLKSYERSYRLIDNSGSMYNLDGQYFENLGDGMYRQKKSTRWRELKQLVERHSEVAGKVKLYTHFKLINRPKTDERIRNFYIWETPESNAIDEVREASDHMENAPRGRSPFTKRLLEIEQDIDSVNDPDANFFILITSDGVPTDKEGEEGYVADQEFFSVIKSLDRPNVTICVRLCTNDEEVRDYFNTKFTPGIDIIDDPHTEALEVRKFNKWINYSFNLHLTREMGISHKVLRLIDQQKLTQMEMISYIELIYGEERIKSLPDPLMFWSDFYDGLQDIVDSEKKVWCPYFKSLKPWINLKLLNKEYGDSPNGICLPSFCHFHHKKSKAPTDDDAAPIDDDAAPIDDDAAPVDDDAKII